MRVLRIFLEPQDTTSAVCWPPNNYERLVGEGEHFAEGDMDALLTHLRDKEQIIHGPVLFDRDLWAKHAL